MILPLWLLNIALRLTVRLPLTRLTSVALMRARMDRSAARFLCDPPDARYAPVALTGARGAMDGLWAECSGADPGRAILYLHGGAYLAGSPQTHRAIAARLAGLCGARALLPAYALAPEHPFPAALDDAQAAYRWLLAQGFAPERIALAGDSAGGGLAAALLLRLARDGLPRPACAVLFSPWADMTMLAHSLLRNARRDAMLPVRRMPEVVEMVMGGADAADPMASPALGRFDAPPPVLIFASRSEALADDATRLAEALRHGGGDVQLELWPRAPHAWPVFAGRLEMADRAVKIAGAFLSRSLARPG
jgi:acetyl esterase/lipase